MSHYSVEELIERWKRGELTADQMLGQIALVLRTHDERLRAIERRLPPASAEPGLLTPGPRREK